MSAERQAALVDSTEIHEFPLPESAANIDWLARSKEAAEGLQGLIRHTRMVDSAALSSHGTVVIKDETEHRGNGFKIRNATWAAMQYIKQGDRSFTTGTSGTFGIGLAEVLSHLGYPFEPVVPTCTPQSKVRVMQQFGADVLIHGDTVDESLLHAAKIAKRQNTRFIHPFANVYSIAGASTIAWELYNDEPDMTHLVLPYGGGSLAAGVATVFKVLRPEVQVVVAQVEKNTAFVDSVLSGKRRRSEDLDTRFGGVAVREVHPLNLALASIAVDRVITLPSDYLYETLHLLKPEAEMGKVLEEASVPSLGGARYLATQEELTGARIVAIATGANPGPTTKAYSAAVARNLSEQRKPLEKCA
jgi:threonine dehydratase